ncbi:MAG TPA: oxygenase MpaB family protein [Mycobacteriales bacterium]|nr:oxygenase MpaB family protein [Mycobacteriales bacterium]
MTAALDSTAADPGLFGPGSVSWTVHADVVMLVAGVRSLLLQALHPDALQGVLLNSTFRDDPWGRLVRTADFVGTTTYNETDAVHRAAARVRGVHRRLGVDQPELLLWVHVCEVASFVEVARDCGLRLTDAEVDAYYAEQVRAAELVGIDPAVVPSSRAEVQAYFAAMRPQLHATPDARRILRFVAVPPMPTWVSLVTPARLAWSGIASLSFALLPAWARRMYVGPAGTLVGGPAARAHGRALRATLLSVPPRLREGPHRKAARLRLGLPHVP